MRLIGVYDANGGLAGELSYILGHLVGVRECALCDITHSPVAKKAAWKALEARLRSDDGIHFDLVHKNERSPAELAASAGSEPCVLIEEGPEHCRVLVSSAELTTTGGDVSAFEALLRSRLMS